MRLPAIVLGLALAACSAKDPRIPAQVLPPTTPNVPTAAMADAASTADGVAMTAPTAPAKADAGTDPSAPVGDPPKPPPEAPTTNVPAPTLDESVAAAKKLLEEPAWGDPSTLRNACDRSLERAKVWRERFQRGLVPTGEVLAALDALSYELDTIDGYASLMFNVSPVKEVRDAAESCRTALSKFGTDVSLDRSIYDALSKVPLDSLDPASKHFAETSLRDFRLSGVDKDEAARARITEINEALTRLSQEYQKNVNGDTRSIAIDPAALDGLPDDWKEQHKPGADGKVTVTTDYPDLLPFLTYATDGAARKALANASAARGYPVNADILKQVLSLRQELAKIVGFPNFAALDLADKMAGTTETVSQFLAGVKEAAAPRIASDLAELLARKNKIDKAATAVEVEDRFYLMQLVRKEKHGFDSKAVRDYFPYAGVRDGILALYGELFGIQFSKREGVTAWHPAVESFEVSRDGKVIGRFFFDMHARADKYKHAAMFPIQTGLSPEDSVGGQRLPWASLVCNFPNPADGPALMDHKDVVTFFHEFGHLIHHLLAQSSKWISTSGINVEWDFVEAPSQLLEEWAWDAKVLARFAKNDKGKAITAKNVEAMKKAEELGKGVELARQLFYAAYSFNMHLETDVANLDLETFTDGIYKAWSPYPRPAEDHLYANFAHLIGYKSAYYTYQWSLSIAKDLFGRFEDKGLLDPKVAAEYRTMVLEPGGTAKAEKLVTDFLGRERNLDAYREWITR